MALQKFNSKTFRNAVIAAAITAMFIGTSVMAENNKICLPLETTQRGEIINAGTSAMIHSNANKGTIAISAFPGPDLHNNPEQLTNLFRGAETDADCFVNNSLFQDSGTSISFYVAGLPVSYKGQEEFGITQLRDNPAILRAVKAQATIAKTLLN